DRRGGTETGADVEAELVLFDVDVLQLVGAEDARVVAEQVTPGQIAAARGAVERGEEDERVVGGEGEGEARVEEVRIDVAQREELPQRRDLRLQLQRGAAP